MQRFPHKLAKEILATTFEGYRKPPKECKQFRLWCLLSEPPKDCKECKYYGESFSPYNH